MDDINNVENIHRKKCEKTYAISTGCGKGVEVTGINEVENNSINGAFAFLKSVGDPVLPLP